jgi:hypothetical protein
MRSTFVDLIVKERRVRMMFFLEIRNGNRRRACANRIYKNIHAVFMIERLTTYIVQCILDIRYRSAAGSISNIVIDSIFATHD